MLLLADYFPRPSSNTNCFLPFIESLQKAGYHITIVTRKYDKKDCDIETVSDHLTVYRIADKKTINTLTWRTREQKSNGFKKQFVHLCSFFSRGWYAALYNFRSPEKRYSGWREKKVERVCVNLFQKQAYHCIISVSYPALTHRIAKNLKDRFSVKWMLYEFDPFCYNEQQYGSNCVSLYLQEQKDFFTSADTIVVTPELYEFYQHTPFWEFKDKIVSMPFPHLKELPDACGASLIEPCGKMELFYGGALNASVRNPSFALKFLAQVKDRIHLSILTGGDLHFVQDELIALEGSVTIHPYQSSAVVYATMQNSDFLVSIGNNVLFQAPGKTFEYMASGKPILHFSKTPNDTALKYLAHYPYCFIIKEYESISSQVGEFLDFCNQNRGKQLSFDEVIHCMPEYESGFITRRFVAEIDRLVK